MARIKIKTQSEGTLGSFDTGTCVEIKGQIYKKMVNHGNPTQSELVNIGTSNDTYELFRNDIIVQPVEVLDIIVRKV